jgi:hypothetical protein
LKSIRFLLILEALEIAVSVNLLPLKPRVWTIPSTPFIAIIGCLYAPILPEDAIV